MFRRPVITWQCFYECNLVAIWYLALGKNMRPCCLAVTPDRPSWFWLFTSRSILFAVCVDEQLEGRHCDIKSRPSAAAVAHKYLPAFPDAWLPAHTGVRYRRKPDLRSILKWCCVSEKGWGIAWHTGHLGRNVQKQSWRRFREEASG